MTIQLLVSVRNAEEAVQAADSGADIIDVKEPEFGSLGFAGGATIREVVDAVAGRDAALRLVEVAVDHRQALESRHCRHIGVDRGHDDVP